MSSPRKSILEYFGYSPLDTSEKAQSTAQSGDCPFTQRPCIKVERDGPREPVGACTVTGPDRVSVAICPNRLYADSYRSLRDVVDDAWGSEFPLIIGGERADLISRAKMHEACVVAFGHGSGKEVSIGTRRGDGAMSMDWILQKYHRQANGQLRPVDFVGVEVQSIDITGNYRAHIQDIRGLRSGRHAGLGIESEHGLNWANVHKRLIPQLIRKGNILTEAASCKGLYFITSDPVFQRFEKVLGDVAPAARPGRYILTVKTYDIGEAVPAGSIRVLHPRRTVRYRHSDFAHSFITYIPPEAIVETENRIKDLLR